MPDSDTSALEPDRLAASRASSTASPSMLAPIAEAAEVSSRGRPRDRQASSGLQAS
ncbi:hypothetical protein IOD13_17120 [Brevibacterium casei]|nr:hypothetical protein [Brevibacterium casei]